MNQAQIQRPDSVSQRSDPVSEAEKYATTLIEEAQRALAYLGERTRVRIVKSPPNEKLTR
jgi:hypothetical protein